MDEVFALGVPLVSRSSPVRKRFRLNRKTPAHLVGISAHSRPSVCMEEIASGGVFRFFLCLIVLGGVAIMLFGTLFSEQDRVGVG